MISNINMFLLALFIVSLDLKSKVIKSRSSLACILKLINYSCCSYPTRASYSGQVDGFRTANEKRVENTAVFETISNTTVFEHPCLKQFQTQMQIFLICILIKQQKHVVINNFI